MEDKEKHKTNAPLLRFFSSQSNEELISLDEYVESMKPEQKSIYYIAGDILNSEKNATFLEKSLMKRVMRYVLIIACCMYKYSAQQPWSNPLLQEA